MKLKVVLHEAEEGGYWAEVPSIPGAQRKATPLRSCWRISTKPWKVAFPSMSAR